MAQYSTSMRESITLSFDPDHNNMVLLDTGTGSNRIDGKWLDHYTDSLLETYHDVPLAKTIVECNLHGIMGLPAYMIDKQGGIASSTY
eukprot:14492008-Heterocapsa_arctica.AAC.1